jgi:hypothetical protein
LKSVVDVRRFIHQVNQAAVRRTHRGQFQFVGADQAAIGLAFVGHGAGQGAGAVLDPHGGGAQRRAVGLEKLWPNEYGSALRIRLISPWRNRLTLLERCCRP